MSATKSPDGKSEDRSEAPALPGEVWRVDASRYGGPKVARVTMGAGFPVAWRWEERGEWVVESAPAFGAIIMAWGAHMAKIAAAERALRQAVFVGYSGPCSDHYDAFDRECFQCCADKSVNTAADDLRRLGVEP